MKKFSAIILALLMVTIPFVVSAEDQAQVEAPQVVANSSFSTDAQVSLLGNGQLIENVASAFLYETNSGTLMYAWNPDAAMAPSSFVKILTALIAIEEGDLAAAVTVRQDVLDTVPEDAVSADLVANEVLTLEELIYCMIVGSANDAASVIADHISGSQDAFIAHMNTRAAEIGCTGTQFTNPHGLHNEQQYTTARDVAKILVEAVKNETFMKVFSTAEHTVPETNKTEERDLETSNFMMGVGDMQIYFDERVIGGRTGVAEDGTRCLATVAEANGMELISVVMGSESVYEEDGYSVSSFGGFMETKALLDAALNGYKTAQVLYDGQVLAQRSVIDGANTVSLGSRVSASAVLPDGVTSNQLSLRYNDVSPELKAPIKEGDLLSTVEVWYGSLCVAQADLYALNDVEKTGTQVSYEQDDGSSTNLWYILIAVIAVLVVGFVAVKKKDAVLKLISKRHTKRYRSNRKRSR